MKRIMFFMVLLLGTIATFAQKEKPDVVDLLLHEQASTALKDGNFIIRIYSNSLNADYDDRYCFLEMTGNEVLYQMYDQGYITKEEYEEAINYELIFTNSDKYVAEDKVEVETIKDNDIQSYYVDYVISRVISDLKKLGYSHYEATRMIYSGGLRIYSAIDMEIQDIRYQRLTIMNIERFVIW